MPLSDAEYRLLVEDAFDRHIRGRLRKPPPPAEIEPLLQRYREALLIARLLADHREDDPAGETIFQQ
jgi:hypothetical protein